MIRSAFDELCIFVEQFIDRLFETDFALHDGWFPLNDWHWFLPPLFLLVATGRRHAARLPAPMGGSDPTGHFAGRKAEKWGRSRPSTCLCPVAFLAPRRSISLVFLGFAGP